MRSNYHHGSTDDSFKITAASRGFTPTLGGKAVTLSSPPAEGAIAEYLHGTTPRLPGAPSHGLLPRHRTRRVCPSSYSQLQRPAPRDCLRQGTPRGLRKLTAPQVSSCCLAQAPRSPPTSAGHTEAMVTKPAQAPSCTRYFPSGTHGWQITTQLNM